MELFISWILAYVLGGLTGVGATIYYYHRYPTQTASVANTLLHLGNTVVSDTKVVVTDVKAEANTLSGGKV